MSTQLVNELRSLIYQSENRLEPTLLLYLVPVLPEENIPWAFSISTLIEDQLLRSQVLSRLIARLPQEARETLLEDELIATQEMEEIVLQAKKLIALAPYLSAPLLQEALEIARTIDYEEHRVDALIKLAGHLPEKAKQKVLQEALEIARTIDYEEDRVDALIKLAEHLPEKAKQKVLQEALEFARTITNARSRARALIQLAPRLSDRARRRTLKMVRAIEYPYTRIATLIELIPYLSEQTKQKAAQEILEAAQTITGQKGRVDVLIKLAEQLPEGAKQKVLQEALETARVITNAKDRAEALIQLALRLSEEPKHPVLQEALEALRIRDALQTLEGDKGRAKALEVAMALKDARSRARVLIQLALHMSEETKHQVLQEVIEATRAIQDEKSRAITLIEIAPYLSEQLYSEALEIADAIEDEEYQALSLEALAPFQSNLQLHKVSVKVIPGLLLREVPVRLSVRIYGLLVQIPENERRVLLEELLHIIQRSFRSYEGGGEVGGGVEFGEDEEDDGDEGEGEEDEWESGSVRERRIERVVNTGFASVNQVDTPIDPAMPLACNQTFYLWLEIGHTVAGAIDVVPTPLPPLPTEAQLKVALFALTDGIKSTPGADVGELQLLRNGEVRVTRQPMQQPSISKDSDLLARRLFFPVQTQEHAGVFSLLCNIYYEQILIQSRLIQARVRHNTYPMYRTWALRSVVNYTLSRTISPAYLTRLASHRLSLMSNNNADNTLNFCFFGSSGEELFKSDVLRDEHQVQNLIEQARGVLLQAALDEGQRYRYDEDKLRDINRLQEDLIRFAIQGYRIYDVIIGHAGIAGIPEMAKALAKLMREPGFVQFAMKQSPRYVPPVALIYDYPLDTNAIRTSYTLCPAFLEAFHNNTPLEEIDCFKGVCPTREKDTLTTICPSGFWGYRHSLGIPLSIGPGLDAPPEIAYQGSLLCAAGVLIDQKFTMREAHIQKMRMLWPNLKWDYADTRYETLKLLKTTTPHLVYFYCHGGISKNDIPYIQVGLPEERGITRDNLRAADIEWDDPRPLVFINGCHTTALEPEKAVEFVSAFIERSAAGVIGTEITIFEPLACTFAEECLRHFLQGVPIGEAVRRARLALLQTGNPLGLVYVPYVLPSLRLVD
jgi:hypothetical protein